MEQVDAKTAVKKLKQQNEKLKVELSTIKKSLNQAISSQKNAEIKSKRPNFSGDNEDEALKALFKKIQKLKKERDSLKVQSSTTDEGNATLENEMKYLKSQLKDAEKEQKLLQKVIKEQEKGLGDLNIGQLNSDKKNQLKEEIKKAKEDYKEIQNKIKSEEQQWKQDHEKMVLLKEKIREKKPKVVDEQQKSPQEKELAKLNEKVDILKNSVAVEEAKAKRNLADLQNSLATLKTEEENLRKKIKEKEQDSQLKALKIKELKQTVSNLQKKVESNKEDKKKEENDPEKGFFAENVKTMNENGERLFSKPS